MKLLDQVMDSSILEMVNFDEMQFALVLGWETTDDIFNFRQLQVNTSLV